MNADEKALLHRHLNGDLDASEQAAFFARLQASSELRRELASQALDETLLSEIVLEGRTAARPVARRRTWIPLSIAAAMLLGLTLILTLGRGSSTGIRVASLEGSATLRRGDVEKQIQLGMELREGDEIRMGGGKAVLEGEGLLLELGENSWLALQTASRMKLERGFLDGRANGVLIVFQEGAATFQKAKARVEVSLRRVQVEVEEGVARVDRDGEAAVDIAAGQYARVERQLPMQTGRLVGRRKLDESVRRACGFLESRRSEIVMPMTSEKRHGPAPRRTYAELVLLAFHRGGYSSSHPMMVELLGQVKGRSLEATYAAALQVMALVEIDPVSHRDRIRQCAQFLVDSQCANGQWDYGAKIALADAPETGLIRRRSEGPASGDNSVTSYAVLALVACDRVGAIDPDVLFRARRWWLQCQNEDGGWGYNDSGDRVANDGGKRTLTTNASYGSATASAVAALAALRRLQKSEPASDDAIRRGRDWLAANFAADHNPRKEAGFIQLHWLVAAARAGEFLYEERFGSHEWYPEGAEFLLQAQRPSGEWTVERSEFMGREKNDVLDTCLAILFLRRSP